MGQIGRTLLVLLLCAGFSGAAMAAEKGAQKGHGKDIKSMSQEQQIKIAQSAAPARISKEATIMVFGQDGKLTRSEKRKQWIHVHPDRQFSAGSGSNVL